VLRRTGHTEAAIDLARLAGFYPAGVLVEILKEDGSMARLPQLYELAKEQNLKIIAIKDLVAYRMQTERIVTRKVSVNLDTRYGPFEVIAFSQMTTGDTHLAIKRGDWRPGDPVIVRVHSSTDTGEILGSLFNNYGLKLQRSIEMIADEDRGLLLYMRHSEKRDALLHQLEDFQKIQKKGAEVTMENYKSEMDQRDFGVGAQILRDLGVTKLRLITNNPKRRIGLIGYGLEIVENISF
jgi:3,4-dihydroxy 2-butanone 4-phosphate synthase/GTP cyclohydrolase II